MYLCQDNAVDGKLGMSSHFRSVLELKLKKKGILIDLWKFSLRKGKKKGTHTDLIHDVARGVVETTIAGYGGLPDLTVDVSPLGMLIE